MAIVYWNRDYIPLEKATVSVEDRGFLLGDGIYEVVRVYGGRPFRLADHLQRLHQSAAAAQLPLPDNADDLPDIIQRLLEENNVFDSNVYIQCTRGYSHPRQHAFPTEVHPTMLVMLTPVIALTPGAREQGVSAITVPDVRWRRCDIKTIMLLPNAMAKTQAHDAGAYEAILVRDGLVTEGSSANVMAVINGELRTHPEDTDILGGITRLVVLELASQLGIPLREEAFTVPEMYAAQEVLLCSSSPEILAITSIDGQTIGRGRPGPVTQRLYEAFCKLTAE
ncbi:MAG: D-alanine aminotransferase [Chloroflexi bacterium ADurb.Bin180]|nr:MAG: D-alanine aminotransferase [Chloroflexi bacterium ADurb.Bin180]